MYNIRILKSPEYELKRLDKPVRERIIKRINRLSYNFDDIRHESLKENLTGLYKLRVGDYRVIYEIISEERIIIIHFIGHRREVYKM